MGVERRWLVLTVRVPDQDLLDLIAEGLIELGGSAVMEGEDRLTTYLEEPFDLDAFLVDATAHLSALIPGHELELERSWLEEEDWSVSWREGIRPRRMGERLVVTPSWIEPELRAGDIPIVIDPEMAFGTGEHATTRGALRSLESAIEPGDRVLDVGTGSAILAIAAAKLGAGEVMAVESDPEAMENAWDNLVRNGVDDRVELIHGLVDDEFLALLGPERFDLIVANVLSSVLVPLLPAFHRALAVAEGEGEPGRLILGGILEGEAEDLISAAHLAGFILIAEDLEEEWWGGLFRVRRRR